MKRTEQAPYTLLAVPGQLLAVDSLTPADVTLIRTHQEEGKARCPTCAEPMQLIITSSGPRLEHRPGSIYKNHDPDDHYSLKAKEILKRHLIMLLPAPGTAGASQTWKVATNAPVHEARLAADVLAISDRGARLVVEMQQADSTLEDIVSKTEQWAEVGIRALWLLDGRRLDLLSGEKLVRNLTLGKLETAMVCAEIPLIYFYPEQLAVYLVLPVPEAVELAGLGDKRLGRVPCLVRRYPLSQLGLKSGDWFLPTRFNQAPPTPPPLPSAPAKRLHRLRAAAQ